MTRWVALAFGLAAVVCGPVSISADAPVRRVVRDESLSPSCGSKPAKVDDSRFVVIGGIEQWVTAKGDSCANPILLFISGGPGNPLSGLSDSIYGAGERDFIVVQWDQRGAGMTYGRSPPAPGETLTIERMAQDGNELAAYLAKRYGKRKVILWGSSWGSILAVHMAKAHPELFYAYVGTSQIVNSVEAQAASYEKLSQLAVKEKDEGSLAVLRQVGSPPWTDPRSFGKVRRIIRKYEARVTLAPPAHWHRAAVYTTAKAEADYEAGEDYSFMNFVGMHGDGMLSKVDLPSLGTDFAIPVFFVEGAHDLLAPPELARRYYESIKAPAKGWVLLEHSGHDPNQEVVDAEYRVLREKVLPLTRDK
ncbi:alpha/beta fold hydrolase [Luteibacter sp. RCC_6_2]|jgi:pimeloyl-ACP methyl ester carboxylesterase|uniref:alpha/beta fold hydrolase n=1 Tax=Luteibacter sp. RCC_6_2 TaxID=3239223 RepID=UPI00352430DB